MSIKIGHASLDERSKSTGGVAGDQNTKEVLIRNWYNGGWHSVLRPKTAMLAEKSAKACEDACNNSKIGYDQNGRNTLYKQAALVKFDLSKIVTACECDCSSLIHVCAIAGGANLTYGANGMTTRNMVQKLMVTGDYELLVEDKYLDSDAYLKRGDILVKTGHTVMVLEDGKNTAPKPVKPATPMTFIITHHRLEKGDESKEVEAVQRILSTHGYSLGSKNPFDGKFGVKTEQAVREFQTKNKLPASGIVDSDTAKKLFGI